MPAFLDPKRPIHTCERTGCAGCAVREKLNCHFSAEQLAKFLLSCAPVLIIGILITMLHSLAAFIGWSLCFLAFFGFVEIRVMCSHCPHYAEPALRSLKCWANYGMIKLWQYRPGPMSKGETAAFFAGLFVVVAYPIPFAALMRFYLPLIAYLLFAVIGAYALRHFLCVKCFNFACPLNRVKPETRAQFLACNPVVRAAYETDKESGGRQNNKDRVKR